MDKKCASCGIILQQPPYRVTKAYLARRKFCSSACASESQKGRAAWNSGKRLIPIDERFWSKVHLGAPEECWLWYGAKNRDGYGILPNALADGRSQGAHRVSWRLANGPIPDGLHVLHHCDNPPCVNPAHLWLGTQADNNRDRDAKGRNGQIGSPGADRKGTRNGNCRLSDAQIAQIRLRYSRGNISQVALAIEYGCGQTQISRIVRGEQRK